ncbi:prepilin peptidase [Aciditerrimonas ferrireducens]|uniref:prepilin peptidase n=1 Tax=Aciditerrimonas ferrireducens TaxID=667306 RepID=UPI002005FD63|nr:A24 family peptidase [Aciditerrimonas ferrireducens]MCK4177236.1 A24 family peptidase [Aciditerrimonas ferrireducens]
MDGLVVAGGGALGLVLGGALELPVAAAQTHRDPWVLRWCCRSCGASLGRPGHPCPGCGAPAALGRAGLLALLGAGLLAALAARLGPHPVLLAEMALTLGLLALSAVDLATYRLPNRLLYPTAGAVGGLELLAAAWGGHWADLGRAVLGAVLALAALGLVHLVAPRGMGFGDVRLAGLIGLGCGWFGLERVFVAFFVAFVLGALVGVVVMVVTGHGRRTRLPFGPFLSLGALSALLLGGPLGRLVLHAGH